MTTQRPAFLLVDKPQGWTSHDVVAKVRRLIGGKVGHAGTLDPMATGLLILGIGAATRLLRFVGGERKEYVATAVFGVATDSLDADGAIVTREAMQVDAAAVSDVMPRFVGEIMQVPPMVSARKVEGRRLHELAREGKVVDREARPVTIDELEMVDFAPCDYPEVTFRVVCSGGTYVRTLADDIARSLGGRAHLTVLRRTRNGGLSVEDAATIGAIEAAAEVGEMRDLLIEPVAALSGYEAVVVDDAAAFRVRNGRPLERDGTAAGVVGGFLRILTEDGNLLAMYRNERDRLVPEVVLP